MVGRMSFFCSTSLDVPFDRESNGSSLVKSINNYNVHSYGGPLVKMNISLVKKDQLVNLNNLKNHVFLVVTQCDSLKWFKSSNRKQNIKVSKRVKSIR
jgi:hypothetical protein